MTHGRRRLKTLSRAGILNWCLHLSGVYISPLSPLFVHNFPTGLVALSTVTAINTPKKKKVFMLLLWPAFCARANKKDCLSLSSMFVLLLPIPGAIKAVAGNELAADNLQVRPGREMRLNRIGVWVDGARYSSMWKSMIPFVIRYCTRFCLAFFWAIAMVIFVDSFQFQFLFAQLVCESIIKNYDEWSALDSCLLIFDLSFATRKPLICRGK